MDKSHSTETGKIRTPRSVKTAGTAPAKQPSKNPLETQNKPAVQAEARVTPPSHQIPATQQSISLEFFYPQANAIFVAGSFNDWNPVATQLTPQGDGKWTTALVLSPGTYEYRLVVDGIWTDDPMSSESAPNPYGGFNSLLRVKV